VTDGSVIGVDLGGTKVAVAQLRGRSLGESKMDQTIKSSPEALIEQLVRMIGEVRSDDLQAVGFGVPSVV
jgi:glucokinase